MNSQRQTISLTSSERKRLRDRKAQQTLRDKRESRIRGLEERVSFCDRHHGNIGTQQANQNVPTQTEKLYYENERLRACLESLRNVLHSWDDEDDDGQSAPRERRRRRPGIGATEPLIPPNRLFISAEHSQPGIPIPTTTAVSPRETIPGILPSATPIWSLVPVNTNASIVCSWFSRPDLIVTCPPQPSPLALLYGTRRNWLADEIHRSIRLRAIRDSECLAVAWLAYNYSKWRVSPSPATFARLVSFQNPTLAQLQHDHPVGIDLLPWPQLRLNLAQNWHRYDYTELTSYLSCCMKVRWPWGQEILERDEFDELQIHQEFLDVFTKESGWGLTPEFISKYPELLEGMNAETLRFQITVGQPD
ncbi:bZIP transcription factor [Aspergillus melleus]|uniref:bZIP transcription factor n=1 Tax=Aspergillus melleus TaxID=138277 RepID=UPI001E8EB4C0|nr:uncharacterized protein LDX57_000629 [Aspergillus melleus]KAH8422876.1 hypothetical protein LDX57_000629 [Aspergillus melleus]